jgi:hypothetical protein
MILHFMKPKYSMSYKQMPVTESRVQPAETDLYTHTQVFHVLVTLSSVLHNSLSNFILDFLTVFVHLILELQFPYLEQNSS